MKHFTRCNAGESDKPSAASLSSRNSLGGEKAAPGPENMAAALVGLAKAGKALHVDLIEPDSVARSGNAWENWNLARYVNPSGAESFRAHERLVFDPKNGKILEHRIVAQDLDR